MAQIHREGDIAMGSITVDDMLGSPTLGDLTRDLYPRRRSDGGAMGMQPGRPTRVTQGDLVVNGIIVEGRYDLDTGVVELTFVSESRHRDPSSQHNNHLHVSKSVKRSKTMDYPKITVIESKTHRAVNVHVEVRENIFWTPDEIEVTIAPRDPMPVWQIIPTNIYHAMRTATIE